MNNLNIITDDFAGHTLIEASAGTGKTYTLALLYIRLLLERKLTVRQILVVTFTKAATAELRTRIRKFLVDLLTLYDDCVADVHLIDPNLHKLHAKFSTDEHKNRLNLAVHGFDDACIYTIHGFCQRALHESAFEAGSDFASELLGDAKDITYEIVLDLWRIWTANFSYLWADFLVQKKVNPKKIYDELKNYINRPYLQVIPQNNNDFQQFLSKQTNVQINNWHKARNLWFARKDIWFEKLTNYTNLNKIKVKPGYLEKWFLAVNNLFTNNNPSFRYLISLEKIAATYISQAIHKGHNAPTDELADALQQLFDELAQINEQFDAYLAQFKANFLAQINQKLPQIKAQKRVLAFDDLINQLSNALHGNNGKLLAQSLRDKFPLALIDEFQDTDPAQYQIFSAIYPPNCNADLCLVGDPKQAIYSFRSADFATYIKARTNIAKKYSLIINYRTEHNLINALNYLFAAKFPFADANLQYLPAKSSDLARKTLILPKELNVSSCNVVRLSENYFKEKKDAQNLAAEHVVFTIANILKASKAGCAYFIDENGVKTPVANHDFAILVDSHSQAKLVGEYLTKYHISWLRKDKRSVFASDEASQLLSILNAYLNPHNEALLRYALCSDLLGKNCADMLALNHDNYQFEYEFDLACKYLNLWRTQGFLLMFRTFLAEQKVAIRLLKLVDGERRLTNLLHLAGLLQQQSLISKTPEALLLWFIRQVTEPDTSLESHEIRLESDAQRVVISTIHAAKGLEYNLVFCPFLWASKTTANNEPVRAHTEEGEQLLDFSRQEHNQQNAKHEEFAERVRLLYVALTRAKEKLWIYWAVTEKSNAKSKASSDLHASSLGWLLHGRNLTADNPLFDLSASIKQQDITSLNQQLLQLIAASSGLVNLYDANSADFAILNTFQAPINTNKLVKANFPRKLKQSFEISSFSKISKHSAHELPQGIGCGIFAFTKGANAGNCLHHMLEDWAKGVNLDLAYVSKILANYNFDANEWASVIFEHLQQVLTSKLTADLTLSTIAPNKRFAELDFTFSLNNFNANDLQNLLCNPKYQLPPEFTNNCKLLDFATVHGFMRGLIDLTFYHQGRWYIADYKSNWLGSDASFYDQNNLINAIGREHYYLQYLIYSVALRRFLRTRGFEHVFGGVFYLFIRAMPDAGIFFTNPSPTLLNDLDNLLAS